MENTKCECGHQNLLGTVLCEACGKPQYEEQDNSPLEMRYDGVARRSQKHNPGVLDRTWNFFSSVKIAVYLIAATLLLSMLGTIYPQESTFYNPELIDLKKYYTDQYGLSGEIYYILGLSHTYESWWYRLLLIMIGTSLIVCSLDRLLPLYRALSKQRIRKHLSFIRRQKVVYRGPWSNEQHPEASDWIQSMAAQLRKKHYKVHSEGEALMAEKYRFSRWGPYINHIGLIIFLLAALLRTIIPGWSMDVNVELLEGETKQIPGTAYFLKNEKFTVELHDNEDIFKKFETKAILYRCTERCESDEPTLEEVKRHDILVNYPLEYQELAVYQFHFEQTRQLLSMNATLVDRQKGTLYGTMQLDMLDPEPIQQVGEYTVRLTDYFPEFVMRDGQPATNSRNPINPALIFTINGGDLEEAETYMFVPMMGIMQQIGGVKGIALDGQEQGRFDVTLASEDDVQIANFVSYLNVRSEQGMTMIWVGAGISMLGLIMGFYWQHRRIWLRVDQEVVSLGGHTNKNWFALRKEIASALDKTGITVDPKSLSNEVNNS